MILPLTFLTACGDDDNEPEQPEPPTQPTDPDPGTTPGENPSQIPGAQILGTWYYLSPDNAIKITITFTDKDNIAGLDDKKCFISVESEFPYYNTSYENGWEYKNSEWEITSLRIAQNVWASARITNVFDNEMWLIFEYGSNHKQLKFKRSDPGSAFSPTGIELAPDGAFGNYVWHTTIKGHNMTLQFTGAVSLKETSDTPISVTYKGETKYLSETKIYGGHSNGYLRLDWSESIIASVAQNSYFVVVEESNKKLKIYNPFTPSISYTLTRN